MTDEEELFHLRKEVAELRHKLAMALRHRDGHHVSDDPQPLPHVETSATVRKSRDHA